MVDFEWRDRTTQEHASIIGSIKFDYFVQTHKLNEFKYVCVYFLLSKIIRKAGEEKKDNSSKIEVW